MTEFERRYPGLAIASTRCPKCKKSGKSIRSRDNVDGVRQFCCGKCGETWKEV